MPPKRKFGVGSVAKGSWLPNGGYGRNWRSYGAMSSSRFRYGAAMNSTQHTRFRRNAAARRITGLFRRNVQNRRFSRVKRASRNW